MLDKTELVGAVTLVHSAELQEHDMRLVHNEEPVVVVVVVIVAHLQEVVQQRVGRFAGTLS